MYCADCECWHDGYISCETIQELQAAARDPNVEKQLALPMGDEPLMLCIGCGNEFDFSALDANQKCESCRSELMSLLEQSLIERPPMRGTWVENEWRCLSCRRWTPESRRCTCGLYEGAWRASEVEHRAHETCGHVLGLTEHLRHSPEKWCTFCKRWVNVKLEVVQ